MRKPIVRVSTHQFLNSYHIFTDPLIDCRVVVFVPRNDGGGWIPPKIPNKPRPVKLNKRRVVYIN